MLLLFETAAGYALFKVLKEGKLQEVEVRNATVGLGCEHHNASSIPEKPLPIACLLSNGFEYKKRQKCRCKMPLVVRRTYQQISARQKVQERWSSSRHSANSRTRPRLSQQQLHWSTANSAKVSIPQQLVQTPQTAPNCMHAAQCNMLFPSPHTFWQCPKLCDIAQA